MLPDSVDRLFQVAQASTHNYNSVEIGTVRVDSKESQKRHVLTIFKQIVGDISLVYLSISPTDLLLHQLNDVRGNCLCTIQIATSCYVMYSKKLFHLL